MIISLSFIGKLPSYTIECIHQIRIYFKGEVYLIIDDLNSEFIQKLEKYRINIIPYYEVKSDMFLDVTKNNINKFVIVKGLIGREELFIRSFERFFLVYNLMKKDNLDNCLFLELDNLIYDNPEKWFKNFTKNLAYMYDNEDRFASGIMLIKNSESLQNFLENIINFIETSNKFMTEMSVLSEYFLQNKNEIDILPTYWNDKNVKDIASENYDKFEKTLFDASSIGIYLLGLDPHHTNGSIVKYIKNPYAAIDYTNLKFEWKEDKEGKRPYVWDGEQWILINNLHVHSKDLLSGLSKPL